MSDTNVDVRLLQARLAKLEAERAVEKTLKKPIKKSKKDGEPPHISSMSDLTREEIAAQIAAAEARGDTKIVRIEGKMDLVLLKLDASIAGSEAIRRDVKDSERSLKANAWVIFAAIIGVVAIIATVGPLLFDLGTKHDEALTKKVQEQLRVLQQGAKPQQ